MPDVTIPIVVVQTPYPGASAEAVEKEITRRIEEAVNTVSGMKLVRSFTRGGLELGGGGVPARHRHEARDAGRARQGGRRAPPVPARGRASTGVARRQRERPAGRLARRHVRRHDLRELTSLADHTSSSACRARRAWAHRGLRHGQRGRSSCRSSPRDEPPRHRHRPDHQRDPHGEPGRARGAPVARAERAHRARARQDQGSRAVRAHHRRAAGRRRRLPVAGRRRARRRAGGDLDRPHQRQARRSRSRSARRRTPTRSTPARAPKAVEELRKRSRRTSRSRSRTTPPTTSQKSVNA